MPYPSPRLPSGPRRRTLLTGAAGSAVLLAGCSSGPSTQETAAGAPSVSQRVRARAVQDSTGLLEQYDAVLAARPALAGLLAPLRGEVARHVGAFGGSTGTPSTPSTSSATSTSPSPAATPVDDKTALAQLAAAERALADRRGAELLTVPGELARLLASVAAAGAVHAYVLTEGAR
ncbi:hypothetical protein IAG44_10635 [Streptomyces roseirectus]|uniref:Lipoprotein n=1 Tax=Streptomyces roseirectus TaxID=2768066 RepID=A0A7H0IAP2_9ACTN|nr:hypothetical protein [Streptomyces roseirectus]QNP69858.1 hypothetical protein IAG44_10635 [Streptomyces roseirectus]